MRPGATPLVADVTDPAPRGRSSPAPGARSARGARQQRGYLVRARPARAYRRGLAGAVRAARPRPDAAHARGGAGDDRAGRRQHRERLLERREATVAHERRLLGHEGRAALPQPGLGRSPRGRRDPRERGDPRGDRLRALDGRGRPRRSDRGRQGPLAGGGARRAGGEDPARPVRRPRRRSPTSSPSSAPRAPATSPGPPGRWTAARSRSSSEGRAKQVPAASDKPVLPDDLGTRCRRRSAGSTTKR